MRIPGLILVAALAASATLSPTPTGFRTDVEAVTALGVTGVQARAVTPGRTRVATSGVADVTTGAPVPADGAFRIASTGKAFVATVVLQLVGEGRLTLDDPVERWLPGTVRGNGNDGRLITIRHLLQHTSGIHDDFPDHANAADYYAHRYDVYTPEELVARAMAHAPDFAPGTSWNYTTTGFVLLDLVIERVTGRPWHREVHDRIIAPLGLTHTFWPGSDPTLPRPHARAYQPYPEGLTDVTEQVIADPEGALVATTADLNRFFRALLGGRLLAPAQLRAMMTTVPVNDRIAQLLPGARYGLGLFQRPLPCGGTYWGHPGGDGGFITDNGVTGDGARSVVVSASSALAGTPDGYLRQQRAADRVVENALCRR